MAFSPTDLTGVHYWLKADSLALANGAAVTTWPDSGPNGYTATSSPAAPSFYTNVLNGKPVVRFVSGKGLVSSAPATLSEQTIFVVYRPTSLSGYQELLGANNVSGMRLYSSNNNGNPIVSVNNTFLGQASVQPPANVWAGLTFIRSRSIAWRYRFGGANANNSYDTNTIPAGATTSIGWSQYYNGDYFLGDIAEIILYSSFLGSGDLSKVDSYLQDKYAIPFADYVASVSPLARTGFFL